MRRLQYLETLLRLEVFGLTASLLAGLATGLGDLPALFARNVSDRLLNVMSGFLQGVMLAATFSSLLVSAIDFGGIWVAVLGIILGAVALYLADLFIPHFHPAMGEASFKAFAGLAFRLSGYDSQFSRRLGLLGQVLESEK